ncbi:MAG: DUF3084 domain-containing protein [Selenomonadaceae bacterium]
MYGIVLIIVLIITGGVIAFIGDRLGTKIGKKRLSVFGLRPRHTSILITILTGICITTLTFGIMAAVSENVRTALFGMEKLNQTMQQTKSSLQTATAELAAADIEKKKTNEALKKAQNDVSDLEDKQSALTARNSALEDGNKLLEAAKNELTQRNDALAVVNSGLNQKNTALTIDNSQLDETNTKLGSDNKELERRTKELRKGMQIMREGDIIYRAGEILSSGVLRGNQKEKDVKADIGSLVQLANRDVAQRLGANTEDSDIWVYPPEYDQAVARITGSKQDMVVRIVAAGNLIRGESIRTSLQLYPNSIIYKDNEFIIARPFTLTGNKQGEAEQAVVSFLKDVNTAAVQKGILADPIRGSVGILDGAQFYSLVQALTPARGNILISAYAKGDTDAQGPLRLVLKAEAVK